MKPVPIEITHAGTPMQVFAQIRVGRFRFYNAATPDMLGTVTAAWKQGRLGKNFVVCPLANRLVGEEVRDGNGRVIAVFGMTVTDAFRPHPKVQQDYHEKLRTLLRQL